MDTTVDEHVNQAIGNIMELTSIFIQHPEETDYNPEQIRQLSLFATYIANNIKATAERIKAIDSIKDPSVMAQNVYRHFAYLTHAGMAWRPPSPQTRFPNWDKNKACIDWLMAINETPARLVYVCDCSNPVWVAEALDKMDLPWPEKDAVNDRSRIDHYELDTPRVIEQAATRFVNMNLLESDMPWYEPDPDLLHNNGLDVWKAHNAAKQI